ncbi:MAG: ankyrin repeat domain-containing protein, partial [Gammaproteobacteria bacterium]|nr:ankyrin repeat domain-containing protein [Gammaproteobacteria bacterium]
MFHDAMSYPDIMEAVGKKIRNNPEVTLTSKEEQAILESCLRSPFIEEMCRQYPEKSCEAILKPILTDKIEEYRAIRIAAMHPVTQGAAQNVNLASVAKSKQGVHGINYGNIKDYFNTLDNDYANLPKKLVIDFIGFIEKNSVFENTAVKTILLAEENQRLHERVRLMEEARKENKRVPKLKETADDYDTICTGFQKFLRYLESDVLCNSSVSYVKKPLGVLWSLFNKMDGDIKSNQEKLDMLCNIMAALDSGRTAYHANEGKYLDATDISCLAGLDERLYGDFCHLIPAQNNTDRNIISSLIPEIIKPFFEQNFDEHGRKKPHPAVYAEYYRAAGYFQLKEEKEIFQLKKDIDREHLKTEYLEHCSKIQSQTNQKLLTIKFDQMMNGFNAAKYPANETAQFVTWLKEKDQLDVIRVQNITDKSIERTVDEILNAFAKSDLFLDRSYALIIYQILKKELTEAIDNGVSVEHHKSIELFSPKVIVEKSYRNYLYQLKGLPEQGAQKYYDFKVSGLDAIIEKWIADELWNDQNPYAHIPCVESIFSDWLKKNKHTIKSDETKKSLLTYCLSKNYLRSAKTLIDGVNSNTLAGTWLKSLPIESWMPFIESGDRDLIDWLFNNYMDLLFSEERTIFMCVAEKCKKDVLRTLLNKFSNNLAVCSQSDRQGRTPLYYAAMSGNQDTVEFLLGLREGNHSLFNNY